ncbi:MAG TPA: hypothetical protein VNS09_15395 [Solirubrobacter sp.]|nr:hypothetical protein [Solirubrobacter sp.]
MPSTPRPSTRLVRAVAAERAELERHRARLAAEAEALRASLARVERGLAEIDERCGLLERLAPAPPAEPDERPEPDGTALRGPAIRDVAIRALIDDGREELHYRAWYDLLVRDGHTILGKDPLAVFLTQISRSPAVRRGSGAGVYALDRRAPLRLQHEVDALQRELASVRGADIAAVRTRRRELTAELARAERALEEVTRQLTPSRLAAAG